MIGIITINDNSNIGNRLQNYAMYKILSNLDQTLNIYVDLCSKNRNKYFLEIKKIKYCLKKVVRMGRTIDSYRCELFEEFSFKYIKHFKKAMYEDINIKQLNKTFDYFVVGSDQVWNPQFNSNGMYNGMLGFAEKVKKIAVAPSIAIPALTSDEENEFKKYLKDFEYLSCREKQGSDLLYKITGKEVTTLIDPTLMLSREDWIKIQKQPKFHRSDKKYILLYFLGEITKEYDEIINKIKKEYGLEVVNILDKNSKYYITGPREFIYLISNCSLVLTDSFHGSVFSYIFDKPIRIFEREDNNMSMNSRLENLVDVLHLKGEIFINKSSDISNILDVDYDKNILMEEQKKFNEYLNKVFKKIR